MRNEIRYRDVRGVGVPGALGVVHSVRVPGALGVVHSVRGGGAQGEVNLASLAKVMSVVGVGGLAIIKTWDQSYEEGWREYGD